MATILIKRVLVCARLSGDNDLRFHFLVSKDLDTLDTKDRGLRIEQ